METLVQPRADKLIPGQVWRKYGPYGWLRIEHICEPGQPDYDGGLPGVVVTELPPQHKARRKGKQFFIPGDWRTVVTDNRFPVGTEAEQADDPALPAMWTPEH